MEVGRLAVGRPANTTTVMGNLLGYFFTERTSGSTSMGSPTPGTLSERSGDEILRRLACRESASRLLASFPTEASPIVAFVHFLT